MNNVSRVLCRGALLVSSVVLLCLSPFLAGSAEPMILTSASKQFVVRGQPQRSLLSESASSDVVYVDPALLLVTCETIKREMARELGWGSRWQGPIYINVHPIRHDNEPVTIVPLRAADHWRYRLHVPDEIDRRNLVAAVVEALLREFADRSFPDRPVELPPWLVPGLTAHLMQGPLAGVALQPRTLDQIRTSPELRTARLVRHADVDERLRQAVHKRGALTFDQLNWPEFDLEDSEAADAFLFSAHLFVRELLRLRGGPDALCAMLAMSPEHLNWQTAFMRAFEPHFKRMVDVEKWWSLSLTRIKSHDNVLVWSPAEARHKMEQILFTPMQVRLTAAAIPHLTPVSLQTVIGEWEFEQQAPLLQDKMNQLQVARIHLPPALAVLADAYRAALDKYLRTRNGAWFGATARLAASRTVNELNALDEQRSRVTGKLLAARAAAPHTGPVPLTHP